MTAELKNKHQSVSTEYNVVILYRINNQPTFKHVVDWNVKDVIDKLDLIGCYGFRFEKRRKTISKLAGQKDVIIKILEKSGTYYINCFVETLEDLLIKPKKNELLIKQMNNMGIEKVVKTVRGDLTFPFFENDYIVDDEGNIVEQ